MNIPLIFASTFALVFLLGAQSLTVNAGRYSAAMVNSVLIGLANLTLLKIVPQSSGWEIVAYVAAGPLAIVSSMRIFGRLRKNGDPKVTQIGLNKGSAQMLRFRLDNSWNIEVAPSRVVKSC